MIMLHENKNDSISFFLIYIPFIYFSGLVTLAKIFIWRKMMSMDIQVLFSSYRENYQSFTIKHNLTVSYLYIVFIKLRISLLYLVFKDLCHELMLDLY